MSEELKPCPFCGSEKATVHTQEDPIANGSPSFGFTFWTIARVVCDGCGATGTTYIDKKKRKAIADSITAWNHRQPDTGLVEAFGNLIDSILHNVTVEYMDEMIDGGMTKAIKLLAKYRSKD